MRRAALEQLVERLATEGSAVRDADIPIARGSDGAWSVGGQLFAALSELGVEFRLDAVIAAAAARTPDAGPSVRGPEWVRFNPRQLDGHAVDRIEAWFRLARRRAVEPAMRR